MYIKSKVNLQIYNHSLQDKSLFSNLSKFIYNE